MDNPQENSLYPNIQFEIKRQEFYSRLLLLARYFFSFFYIIVPHYFLLFFYAIYIKLIQFLAFWIALFTGKYPHFAYENNMQYLHWRLRVHASVLHLTDEYPVFGLNTHSESIVFHVEHTPNISRSSVLIRSLFGFFYCYLPHTFILFFCYLFIGFMQIFIVLIVLITGQFPKEIFDFIQGTLRWEMRVKLYLLFLIQDYPAFSFQK